MNVLIVNPIMYTCESNNIRKVESLKDTLMYNVCMGFLKNGDKPTLIVAKDFMPLNKEEYPFEIVFMETEMKKIFLPRFIPMLKGLKKYLKENVLKFDYAICSECFSLSTFTTAKIFKGKCFIWQEMAKHQKKFWQIPSKLWHNLVVKHIYIKNIIIPRSNEAKNFIKKYSNFVSSEVIEHGMNIEMFDIDKKHVKKQFIVVSQLIERKRIDLIIKKFAKFLNKFDNEFTLKICGTGNLRNELEELVKNLNIEKNVSFLGQCNHKQINEEFSKSIAMLIYTEKDNNMVSIIESIASATPVVTTSIPYNSLYIKEEKLGIVSDIWDENDLYNVYINFNKYSKNCVEYREKLSAKYTAECFDKVFKNKEN